MMKCPATEILAFLTFIQSVMISITKKLFQFPILIKALIIGNYGLAQGLNKPKWI